MSSETFGNLEGWGWELTAELLTHHGRGIFEEIEPIGTRRLLLLLLVKSKNVSYPGRCPRTFWSTRGNLKRLSEGQGSRHVQFWLLALLGDLSIPTSQGAPILPPLCPSRAALVPIFSFGENNLFNQVENTSGTLLRRVQNRLQKIMGISLPLFHGRGVFQYSFGFMPFRQPINTVGELICRPAGAGCRNRVWMLQGT